MLRMMLEEFTRGCTKRMVQTWGGDVYARPLLILSIPPASSDQFDFPSETLALPLSSYNGTFHHPPETLVYLWAAAES